MPTPSATNRKPPTFRGPRASARPAHGAGPAQAAHSRQGPRPAHGGRPGVGADKPEHEILFQTYFKSVGPRTYAAQVKKASNDNQYLVLTEGKRDEKTGEVRKARLFVYSEDFVAFFRMLQESAQFIRANPVPEDVKQKRDRFWARKASAEKAPPATSGASGTAGRAPAPPGAR